MSSSNEPYFILKAAGFRQGDRGEHPAGTAHGRAEVLLGEVKAT
jgi:hypothetical protein